MTDNKLLAEQFFTATANADRELFQKICDKDFEGKQNDGPPMSANQLADYSALVLSRVNNFRYKNVVRASTETGFVEEHDVCCTFADGGELSLRVCVVADVQNNRIISVREYADSRAARKLIEALSSN